MSYMSSDTNLVDSWARNGKHFPLLQQLIKRVRIQPAPFDTIEIYWLSACTYWG